MGLKLLLFGANGRTGREFWRRATASGHQVTPVVRSHDRLEGIDLDATHAVAGSVTDPSFVRKVVRGHDIVISTLGPQWPTTSAAAIYADSAEAFVPAMKAAGVQRLLVTSSALLFPQDALLTRVVKWIVPAIVNGAKRMEDQIRASDIDYVIVRTTVLNDLPTTESTVKEEGLPKGAHPVSRSAVAAFLLSEVQHPRFHRAIIGVGGSAS